MLCEHNIKCFSQIIGIYMYISNIMPVYSCLYYFITLFLKSYILLSNYKNLKEIITKIVNASNIYHCLFKY